MIIVLQNKTFFDPFNNIIRVLYADLNMNAMLLGVTCLLILVAGKRTNSKCVLSLKAVGYNEKCICKTRCND